MIAGRIQHILQRSKSLRILVIGDVMLDEFVWGKVSRISPEAPVPVVEVNGESSYPGGAANVARNLQPFCCAVDLCGLTGCDLSAERLSAILEGDGISARGLVAAKGFPTIVKTRIVARQQQVVRVDREKRGPAPSEARRAAVERVRGLVAEADGVILEDYGKGLFDQGFLDELLGIPGLRDKFLAADPNPTNPLNWGGVNVLKPNRSEAFHLAGLPDPGAEDDPMKDRPLLEAIEKILSVQQVGAILVTLGEHGMLLKEVGCPPYHTPTRAREVFDVSGAGDTAIALFTLSACSGATLTEAAEISNHASGIVVAKLGTATLTPDELVAAIVQ